MRPHLTVCGRKLCKKELNAVMQTHTWDVGDLSPGKTGIGYKRVYKIKNSFRRGYWQFLLQKTTKKYGID